MQIKSKGFTYTFTLFQPQGAENVLVFTRSGFHDIAILALIALII